MIVVAILIGIAAVFMAFALCKVSGDCSRQEEQEEREKNR